MSTRSLLLKMAMSFSRSPQPGTPRRPIAKFQDGGPDTIASCDVAEHILFSAIPRADTKPTGKVLIDCFGSLARAVSRSPSELLQIRGIWHAAVVALKTIGRSRTSRAQGSTCAAHSTLITDRRRLLPCRHGAPASRSISADYFWTSRTV